MTEQTMSAEPSSLLRKARVLDDPPMALVSRWLGAGWRDFKNHQKLALSYGLGLFVLGWVTLAGLWMLDLGWMILPTVAGGLLVGPIATFGLYKICRAEAYPDRVPERNGGQIFIVGAVLMVLVLTWIRAATILFAIFFGLQPFPGFLESLLAVFTSGAGLTLLVVGSLVGGLFAALGFAVSAFSLPMLLDRPIDGFSAMGLSFHATVSNFRITIVWAAAVTLCVGFGVLTGLVAMIVIFPVLGFATWHAYDELFGAPT